MAYPSLEILENGRPKTVYIVNDSWYNPGGGKEVNMPHGGRSYLTTSDAFGPDNYYSPSVNGGSWEWDIDLHESGCSCNAALYLVMMPGRKADGSLDPGRDGHYYCDTNAISGVFCPDFDMFEGNTWAMHSTSDKCDAPNEHGHYAHCDTGGHYCT